MLIVRKMSSGMHSYRRYFCSLSALSLVTLVLQSSLLVVLTHYSMEGARYDEAYYVSVLILHQEIVKLFMCLVIVAVHDFRKVLFPNALPLRKKTDVNSDASQVLDCPKDKKVGITSLQTRVRSLNAPTRLASPTNNTEVLECGLTNQNFEDESYLINVDDDSSELKRDMGGEIEHNFKTASLDPVRHSGDQHMFSKFVGRAKRIISVYCRCLYVVIVTRDSLKLLIPAILFTAQNLLIFVGLRHLDPVSFQICSQIKLLSAALFSVWMLDRHLSRVQWGSLVLLIAGILFTQLGGSDYQKPSVIVSKAEHTPRTWENTLDGKDKMYGTLLGIGSCLISGISSSYAGVYFEKVVKTTKSTLAVRNLQLSVFAIPLAIFSILVLEVLPNWSRQRTCGQLVKWNVFTRYKEPPPLFFWNTVWKDGTSCPVKPFYIWQGFDKLLTWNLVFIHAIGGMLVAVVMRYADNILKGFATALAVILSGVLSAVLWGYYPSRKFAIGALLVIISIILFQKFELKG